MLPTKTLAVVASVVAALGIVSCGPTEITTDAEGAWIGSTTTEGTVTTVVNEAGSIWDGNARLVEEASIGVDVGEPEYMLGNVMAVTADSERIYVLDRQPPVLRVYDFDGRHLLDIGGEGQGPGEFNRPSSVVGNAVTRPTSSARTVVTWARSNRRCPEAP